MKNKNNKKTNLLTRILHDKKGIYVTTAMKIVIALVTGITVLTGSTYVVKDVVMPQTESKIIEEFDKDYSAEGSGSGGTGGSTDITRSGTVLEGCSYTLANGTVLNAGEDMPFAPSAGDIYEEGDYKYTYRRDYDGSFFNWFGTEWSVAVRDKTKSSYGQILSEIAGVSVTNMAWTFEDCTLLTSAPTIPDSIIDMSRTFAGCTSLTYAPMIPNSVTNMYYTFVNCTSLVAAPYIPNGVTDMSATFAGCASLTTAPAIPESASILDRTFGRCPSLVGEIEVNAQNVESYYAFLGYESEYDKPNINLITITGTCSEELKVILLETANDCDV